jgi:hypothetical protein
LFDHDATTHAKAIQPHLRLTHRAAADAAVVLHISDTTTLSVNHPHTQGLGPTGSGGRGQGLLLHSTLAVDISGGVVKRLVETATAHPRRPWQKGCDRCG